MNEARIRIGYGYDVHRMAQGRPLKLGGVHIPFERGPEGHSDADVLLHAIIDAVLGAAAMGDIGTHYPDTDRSFENVDSRELLLVTRARVEDAGFSIVNVDSTIVLERPRIAPFIHPMRLNIANDLDLEIDRVSVKATTSELLGFVGDGAGIVAHAVCLLREL